MKPPILRFKVETNCSNHFWSKLTRDRTCGFWWTKIVKRIEQTCHFCCCCIPVGIQGGCVPIAFAENLSWSLWPWAVPSGNTLYHRCLASCRCAIAPAGWGWPHAQAHAWSQLSCHAACPELTKDRLAVGPGGRSGLRLRGCSLVTCLVLVPGKLPGVSQEEERICQVSWNRVAVLENQNKTLHWGTQGSLKDLYCHKAE